MCRGECSKHGRWRCPRPLSLSRCAKTLSRTHPPHPPTSRALSQHLPAPGPPECASLSSLQTPLGELNWIFTAITDTIAWNVLPRALFQKLFRQVGCGARGGVRVEAGFGYWWWRACTCVFWFVCRCCG